MFTCHAHAQYKKSYIHCVAPQTKLAVPHHSPPVPRGTPAPGPHCEDDRSKAGADVALVLGLGGGG